MSKTTIPDVVKELLFGYAAGRCEYRGCNKRITLDDLTRKRGKFSAFAHIVADDPGGPRGDPVLSAKLAKDLNNIMLLCLDHHRLIDVDDVAGHPVELLQEYKRLHEERIQRLTEIDDQHRTMLVRFQANIGSRKGLVDAVVARAAVLPRYPVDDGYCIDLAHGRVEDGDSAFWVGATKEIDSCCKPIQDALARCSTKHLSIFALGPIPLLMYLGKALGDIAPGEAFQCRRNPEGWDWQPETGNEPPLVVVPPDVSNDSRQIALVLSISDSVDKNLIARCVPETMNFYEVRVGSPKPDIIRCREQVVAFRTIVRALLADIRERHGADVVLNVFPAVPNSLAVEFGKVLLPKTDPEMRVWELNRGHGCGWKPVLTLLPPLHA